VIDTPDDEFRLFVEGNEPRLRRALGRTGLEWIGWGAVSVSNAVVRDVMGPAVKAGQWAARRGSFDGPDQYRRHNGDGRPDSVGLGAGLLRAVRWPASMEGCRNDRLPFRRTEPTSGSARRPCP